MRVVFLDRDNTLNIDTGHVYKNLQALPGVSGAIKKLNDADSIVIVVSNQSGIARGYYTRERMLLETHKFFDSLKPARIDAYFYCPHGPWENCTCRKPKPGLFRQAIDSMHLDTSDMWVVGDKVSDMIAGIIVGCKPLLIGRDVSNLAQAVNVILS